MDCVERWKAVGAMVVVEFSLAMVNVVFKKALNGGMDHVIIVLYRQSIAAVFLIPFVYLWERGSWNKLTARVIGQMFLGALLGLGVFDADESISTHPNFDESFKVFLFQEKQEMMLSI